MHGWMAGWLHHHALVTACHLPLRLCPQDVQPGHEDYLWMWKVTAERVAAGDHFVLWSEEAIDVATDEQARRRHAMQSRAWASQGWPVTQTLT